MIYHNEGYEITIMIITTKKLKKIACILLNIEESSIDTIYAIDTTRYLITFINSKKSLKLLIDNTPLRNSESGLIKRNLLKPLTNNNP